MNRYPVWKYAILVIALLVGVLYTLPNFFGEAPAVQVSSAKATIKVDAAVLQRVEEALKAAGVKADFVSLDGTSVRARFDTPDNQLKAKDAIQKALVPDAQDPSYIVALNLRAAPHHICGGTGKSRVGGRGCPPRDHPACRGRRRQGPVGH